MMKLLLAVVCLGLAHAAPKSAPACQVSDWSDWSKCERTSVCPQETTGAIDISYPLPIPTMDYDEGRAHMSLLQKLKQEQWDEALACRAAGTCPEFALRPSVTGAITLCENGFAGNYPCNNIDMYSFVSFSDLCVGATCSNARGNDIWGWTDPQNGDEYAIMGMNTGTSFVRITDPQNPEVLAYLPSRTSSSTWRDMKVHNNHAYIVSEASGHGMQVFDLTKLRDLTAKDAKVVNSDAEYSKFGNAHNIAVNEDTGHVYVIGQTRSGSGYECLSGGLHIIDVNEPLNPQLVGCFANDGYTHDCQCVTYHGPHTAYQGREICFNSNENTLTIVDVTNKASPNMLSRISYSGVQYTHQNWLTEDHSILLLDDELDESRSSDKRTRTYVWNVASLTSPVLEHTHYSTQNAIDHNQYIKGDYSYQANYEAGLRILSIDQSNYQLTEVAYFDVFPSGTAAAFNGAWSVYPYFDSGTTIVSSIDYGLFVLRPNHDAMSVLKGLGGSYGYQSRARSIVDQGDQCPQLKETKMCDAGSC